MRAGDDRREPALVAQSKVLCDARPPQIALDQDDSAAGHGGRHGQVAGGDALALALLGAGDGQRMHVAVEARKSRLPRSTRKASATCPSGIGERGHRLFVCRLADAWDAADDGAAQDARHLLLAPQARVELLEQERRGRWRRRGPRPSRGWRFVAAAAVRRGGQRGGHHDAEVARGRRLADLQALGALDEEEVVGALLGGGRLERRPSAPQGGERAADLPHLGLLAPGDERGGIGVGGDLGRLGRAAGGVDVDDRVEQAVVLVLSTWAVRLKLAGTGACLCTKACACAAARPGC